ncbi:MAG: hypothetical protein ACJ71R_03535 [Nitrososphaeraceae archaeon]|jgi:hypothetical protein
MEHLSSAMEQQHQEHLQQQAQWRRDKVQELCSKGYSQREQGLYEGQDDPTLLHSIPNSL